MTDKNTRPCYSGVEITIRIFQTLVQFTLYHSVACLLTGIGMGENENWRMYLRMGVLLLPLLLYSFSRAYVRNLLLFTLIHLGSAILLIGFFPQWIGEAVAIFVCLIVMIGNSVRFRITESYYYKECPNLLTLIFLFTVYGIAAHIGMELLMQLCFYELMVFIIFYLISMNLENTEKFIHINRDTANFPVRQMKGVNQTLLCFFAVVLLVGMLLVPQFHPELLGAKMGEMIRLFLRWIFLHFMNEEIDSELMENNPVENQAGSRAEILDGTPSPLALFLQELLLGLTKILVVAGILFAVGYGLYQIYKRFYAVSLNEGADEEGKDVVTVTESIPIIKRKREQDKTAGSNNRKIRYQYKRSVKRRKGKGQILAQTLTPTEIEDVLEQPIKEEKQTERLITLYEKARYGKEECTREELEEVKKMV